MRSRLLLLCLLLFGVLSVPLWRRPLEQLLAPRGGTPPPGDGRTGMSQSFVITDMDLLQTRGGNKEFRLTSRRVFSEDQEKLLELENVRAAFFNNDDAVTCTVSGDRGLYRPGEQELAVSGDVVVTGREDVEVRAESIRYTARENRFDTETAATVQGRGIMARGEGLRYEATAGTLRIGGKTGRVSTTFRTAPR